FSDEVALARSEDGGEHWTDPAILADHGEYPTIVNDGAGTWIIAWRSYANAGGDFDIRFTRSIDGGTTWSAPAALNLTAATDTLFDDRPHLAFSAGVWVAGWDAFAQDDGLYRVLVARSVDGGSTWSAPAALASGPATTQTTNLRIAGDGSGSW